MMLLQFAAIISERRKRISHVEFFTPIPSLGTADVQELLDDQSVENVRLEFKSLHCCPVKYFGKFNKSIVINRIADIHPKNDLN